MLSCCFPKLQLKKASSELCVIYKVIKLDYIHIRREKQTKSFINSLKALKFIFSLFCSQKEELNSLMKKEKEKLTCSPLWISQPSQALMRDILFSVSSLAKTSSSHHLFYTHTPKNNQKMQKKT